MADEGGVLDGLVTFYASHHAMRAEKVLLRRGLSVAVVPGPREISPNCGVALQFEYRQVDLVRDLLTEKKVRIEAIHQYRMEASPDGLQRYQL